MYEPQRTTEVLGAVDLPEDDGADAFRTAPRRAVRSRAEVLRTRVAPTVVSVALLATSGAFALNLKASESATSAVPAPVREDDAISRDLSRELVETESDEAPAEEAPAEEAPADEADVVGAEAFVAGNWAASFGSAAGQKFAQTDLTVRSQPRADASKLGTVKEAKKVSVTDKVVDGWRQVALGGKIGYVVNQDLGDKAPVKEAPKPVATNVKASSGSKASAKSGSGSAPAQAESYTGATSYSGKSVLGLKPKAMVVYNAVTERWSFSAIGGYRATGNRSNHGQGGAIDFMLTPGKDSAKGWAVANYVAANASAFGVDHIIFEQKIWTPYSPQWRGMENRGSSTANHMDHVHVSVKL